MILADSICTLTLILFFARSVVEHAYWASNNWFSGKFLAKTLLNLLSPLLFGAVFCVSWFFHLASLLFTLFLVPFQDVDRRKQRKQSVAMTESSLAVLLYFLSFSSCLSWSSSSSSSVSPIMISCLLPWHFFSLSIWQKKWVYHYENTSPKSQTSLREQSRVHEEMKKYEQQQ